MQIVGFAGLLSLVACGRLFHYSEPGGDISVQPVEALPDEEDPDPVVDTSDHGQQGPIDDDRDGAPREDDCDDDDDTVYPGAEDPCGDEVDSDCDGDDCVPWEDGFEGGVLDRPWVSAGPTRWSVRSDRSHDGVASATNADIDDLETSELFLEVDTPLGGAVSFWHSGSTEPNFDELGFTIDGEQVGTWSGEWDWQESTFTLHRGVHELAWSYTKDVSISVGGDTVLVDDLFIEGGGP